LRRPVDQHGHRGRQVTHAGRPVVVEALVDALQHLLGDGAEALTHRQLALLPELDGRCIECGDLLDARCLHAEAAAPRGDRAGGDAGLP
jgi:hypothetical protein